MWQDTRSTLEVSYPPSTVLMPVVVWIWISANKCTCWRFSAPVDHGETHWRSKSLGHVLGCYVLPRCLSLCFSPLSVPFHFPSLLPDHYDTNFSAAVSHPPAWLAEMSETINSSKLSWPSLVCVGVFWQPWGGEKLSHLILNSLHLFRSFNLLDICPQTSKMSVFGTCHQA